MTGYFPEYLFTRYWNILALSNGILLIFCCSTGNYGIRLCSLLSLDRIWESPLTSLSCGPHHVCGGILLWILFRWQYFHLNHAFEIKGDHTLPLTSHNFSRR